MTTISIAENFLHTYILRSCFLEDVYNLPFYVFFYSFITMNKIKFILPALLLLAFSSFWLMGAHSIADRKLRHVVAFKFKPDVTVEQQQQATRDFYALKKKIPQIIEFEGGPDLNFQQKSGKFTHCFIVTVRNEKDLATYGAHPDHKAFSQGVDPLLAEVMVVDYFSE